MQEIIINLKVGSVLAELVDEYNQSISTLPSITRGMRALLRLRLFDAQGNPLPVAGLAFVSWDFVLANDWNTETAPQIRVQTGISVVVVSDGGVNYTEIHIPLTETNTEELISALGSNPSVNLGAELAGFEEEETVPGFLMQFDMTVRNRRGTAGTGVPVPVGDGTYSTAQVDALLITKAEVVHYHNDLYAPLDHDHDDRYANLEYARIEGVQCVVDSVDNHNFDTISELITYLNTLDAATVQHVVVNCGPGREFTETDAVTFPGIRMCLNLNGAHLYCNGGVTLTKTTEITNGSITGAFNQTDGTIEATNVSFWGGMNLERPVRLNNCRVGGSIVSSDELILNQVNMTGTIISTARLVTGGNSQIVATDDASPVISSTSGQVQMTNTLVLNQGSGGGISCDNGADAANPNMLANVVIIGGTLTSGTAVTLLGVIYTSSSPSGDALVNMIDASRVAGLAEALNEKADASHDHDGVYQQEDIPNAYNRSASVLASMMMFVRNGAVNAYLTLNDVREWLKATFSELTHNHDDAYAALDHEHSVKCAAGAGVSVGSLVYLTDVDGALTCLPADLSAHTADACVSALSGGDAVLAQNGIVTLETGIVAGTELFLGNGGNFSAIPPGASGEIVQKVGRVIDATTILLNLQPGRIII